MKKLLLIFSLALLAVAANAQKGQMAAGVNLNYGTTSGYHPLGLGAKFQYEFVKNVRGEASMNYFFPKKEDGVDTNLWDVNVNFHYLIGLGQKAKCYPLFGLSYETVSASAHANGVKVSASDSELGLNMGAGAEFLVSSNIKLNAEVKYQTEMDWVVFGIGAAIVF